MPNSNLVPILVASLAAMSVLGLLVAVFYSHLDKNSEGQKRLSAIAASGVTGSRSTRQEDSKRRDIERTLREIEEKQRAVQGSKPSLIIRMRQADLKWSTKTYYGYCGLVGFITFIALLGLFGLGALSAVGFGAAMGLLGPHLYVSYRRNHRFKKFTKEFPNAIDVIVRGVKSGLPAVDCLRIISVEAPEPIRSEFKEIVDDQTLGLPVDQAVQRLTTRIPLAEAKFFAIVIALQSRTGGNLSDALGGLAKVLRERQKMQGKIRAMSAEAKASAGIIGSLPIAVAVLMQLAAPKYIELLFTTFAGKAIIAGSIIWMALGVFVMSKMIRFDF